MFSDECIRTWAVKQLRRINDCIGIRQAGLLADLAQADLYNTRHSPLSLLRMELESIGITHQCLSQPRK